MADDVTTLRDRKLAYEDGTLVRVRILRVPESERFEEGLKYTFHYGDAGSEHPIIRFDNHHGVHELHLEGATFEIDYPGLERLVACFRAALPAEKRGDW